MKRSKFLTLLAVPFLLTGCSTDLTEVSKPSFASLGTQVTYSKFAEESDKACAKIDFLGEDLLKSKELNFNTHSVYTIGNYVNRSTSVRVIKTVEELTEVNKVEMKTKYDAKKQIILSKATVTALNRSIDATGEEEETTTNHLDEGAAVVTIDGGKSAVKFNNKSMVYSVEKSFGEGEDPAKYIDMQFKMGCNVNLYERINTYLATEEEKLINYSFYINGSIFTYVLEKTTIETDKDEHNNIITQTITNDYAKMQYDFTETKQSLKCYVTHSKITDYRNTGTSKDGSFDQVKFALSSDISIKSKSVSLSSIKISKYDEVEL